MEVIEDKTKVSIAYVLLEKGGRILEEIPATHPFVYIHGYNNIIPGLETALAGRKLGERFSVDIPANLGYGPYRKDLILKVPKAELQDVGELWLGMELEMFMDNDIREFQQRFPAQYPQPDIARVLRFSVPLLLNRPVYRQG